MKKPPKKKRIPSRRKPLKWHGARTMKFALPSLANFDRMEARDRAMLERMPPEVREEWERLIEPPLSEDDEPDPADEARLDEILKQYEDTVSEEDIARHVVDIVREREIKQTAPEP